MPRIKTRIPQYKRTVYIGGRTRTQHVKAQFSTSQGHVANRGQDAVLDSGGVTESTSSDPQSAFNPDNSQLSDVASSAYYSNKKKEICSWQACRNELFSSYLDRYSPATPVTCVECAMANPHVLLRCRECGPLYQGCKPCIIEAHKERPLHVLEEWKVSFILFIIFISESVMKLFFTSNIDLWRTTRIYLLVTSS